MTSIFCISERVKPAHYCSEFR